MEERSRTTEQVPRVVAKTRDVERRRGNMAGAEILDQEGERGGGGDVHRLLERLHLDLLVEVVDVDRLARYNVHFYPSPVALSLIAA